MISLRTAVAALASMCVWTLIFALVPVPRAGGAAAAPTVGVVEFYAPTPLVAFPGVVPEQFAAEDLSRLLARSASARLAVIPSATMRRAEGAMHWQAADVLHFDRLRALATAVGADRLVVGWIPLFSVAGGGHGVFPIPDDGSGPLTADANIVVQVFDSSEGRVVKETRQSGFALGVTTWQVVTQALHVALERALPELLKLLGVQAP